MCAEKAAPQAATKLAQAGVTYGLKKAQDLTQEEVHAQLALSCGALDIPPFILSSIVESIKQQPNLVIRATNQDNRLLGYLTVQVFKTTHQLPALSLAPDAVACYVQDITVDKTARRQKIGTGMLNLLTQRIKNLNCPLFATGYDSFPVVHLQSQLESKLGSISLNDMAEMEASLSNQDLPEEMRAQMQSLLPLMKQMLTFSTNPEALNQLSQDTTTTIPFLQSQGFQRITDEGHPDGNRTDAALFLVQNMRKFPGQPPVQLPEDKSIFAYQRMPQPKAE